MTFHVLIDYSFFQHITSLAVPAISFRSTSEQGTKKNKPDQKAANFQSGLHKTVYSFIFDLDTIALRPAENPTHQTSPTSPHGQPIRQDLTFLAERGFRVPQIDRRTKFPNCNYYQGEASQHEHQTSCGTKYHPANKPANRED